MTTSTTTLDQVIAELPDYVASCQTCATYLDHRGDFLVPHIHAAALRRDITPIAVLLEFLTGLHHRHVAGLSLDAG